MGAMDMHSRFTLSQLPLASFTALMALLFGFALFNNSSFSVGQYGDLAQSFLSGSLHFSADAPYDAVLYEGRAYWPLGPFPAVILMPFVAVAGTFHTTLPGNYTNVAGIAIILALIWSLARRLGYSSEDSLYWAGAFVFGSMCIGIVMLGGSWHYAHMVAVLLSFAALVEYTGKRRYWLIGLFVALLLLTRSTAALIVCFFVLDILFGTTAGQSSGRVRKLVQLGAPILAGLAVFCLYNYARFHTLLDQGYRYQTLIYPPLIKAREYGLFSLQHLPGNLYYAFLSAPMPVFKDGVSHVLRFP